MCQRLHAWNSTRKVSTRRFGGTHFSRTLLPILINWQRAGATGERIRRFLKNFPRENQTGVSATWKAISALCNITTTEEPLARPRKKGTNRRYAVYRYRERVSLLLRSLRKSWQTRIRHKRRSYRHSSLLFPLRRLCERQGSTPRSRIWYPLSAKAWKATCIPPPLPPSNTPQFYCALRLFDLGNCCEYALQQYT